MSHRPLGAGVDFPTAWDAVRATTAEWHNDVCSYRTSDGAFLCDCAVLQAVEYMFKQQSQLRQTVQHLRDVDAMSCGQREELEQVVARIREALRLRYAAPPGAVLDDIETIVGDHATP